MRMNPSHLSSSRSIILVVLMIMIPMWHAPAAVADDPPPVNVDEIKVKAPAVGKPKDRVGAGARGPAQATAEVFLLAPDQTGATSQTQPTIYWFLTGDTDVDIELVVAATDDNGSPQPAERPLVRRTYSGNLRAGLHALSLAKEAVTLHRGSRYRVSLLLHNSPDPSEDYRSIADLAVLERSTGGGDSSEVRTLAEAGLWYDAVDAAIKQSATNPNDTTPRRQLAGMLWQQHTFCTYSQSVFSSLHAAARTALRKKEAQCLQSFVDHEVVTPATK